MVSSKCNNVSTTGNSTHITFYDFLILNKIKFINVFQQRDDQGKKQYKGLWSGWNNLSLEDLVHERDRRNSCQQNSYFCRIEDSPFVVVDIDIPADTEEHNDMIDEIINQYGGGLELKSSSGKTHIWLKKHPNDKNKSTITNWKPKVDLIYQTICELTTSEILDFSQIEDSCFTDYKKDDDLDRNIVVSKSVIESDLTNEQIELLDIIKTKYWSDYSSWISLILAVFKISGSYENCDEYSQKADNYDCYESIVKKIDTFKNNNFSEGTIRYYAKLSNSDKYNEIRSKYFKFTDIDTVSELDLALKVLDEVGDIIISDKHEKNLFILDRKTNIWTATDPSNKDSEIKNLIKDTLIPIVDKKLLKYKGKKSKQLEEDDLNDKKKWNAIRNKITNQTPLTSIKTCLLDEIRRNSTDYKLDLVRPELFCFSCGKAYNTDTNKLVNIEPEDYISRTSGRPYIELSDVQYDVLDQEFEVLLGQIFFDDPDKTLSIMSQLRYSQTGYKREVCDFWSGTGGNGKGVIMDLHKYCLGEQYYKDVGHTLITAVSKSSLDSLVASIDKLRCVVMSEPPEKIPIAASKLKSLTGENEMAGRDLHQRSKDSKVITSTISFFCQHNHMVNFDEEPTNAMYRRVKSLEFKAEFTESEERVDIDNHIYPANIYWKKESTHERFRMYFINRLILHTPKEVFYPQSVLDHSRFMLDGSDQFLTWVEDNIVFLPTKTEDGQQIPKKECNLITFKDFSQKYRLDNSRLNLSTGQVKNKLRMCKSLKSYISDTNPKTRSKGGTILFCKWIMKDKDYLF